MVAGNSRILVARKLDVAIALWEPLDGDVSRVTIGHGFLDRGESAADARSLHE